MDQQPRSFRLRSLINLILLIVIAALVAGLAIERRWRQERARAAEERALEDLRRNWDERKAGER